MAHHQLTREERYQIYILDKTGLSQRAIARCLHRACSTISRELKRNRGLRGYRPKQAQELSDQRRGQAAKFYKVTHSIRCKIVRLLRQDLSPEQLVNYLKDEGVVSLHHETIYRLIYEDKARGGDLYQHLRIVCKPYRKRYGSQDNRGRIKNRVSIHQRPTFVDDNRHIGHWEGDTVIGKGRRGALLTLVERKTLYTVIIKLAGKHAVPLVSSMIKKLRHMTDRIKTITVDNGLEFSDHERLAKALNARVYFADPYSSWQRGINENTNGLIRQYFPKRTNFDTITQIDINRVMKKLNNRPRKTRGYKTPNELFNGQRVNLLAG